MMFSKKPLIIYLKGFVSFTASAFAELFFFTALFTAVNPRDAADDALALADRFGLSLGFHVVDQDGYLAIVAGYAHAYDLPFDPADAVGWATRRGARSGRVAWHYIVDLAGRNGRSLK